MKGKLYIKNGRILVGHEDFLLTAKNLPDGEYIYDFQPTNNRTVEEWRKYYFYLRDILFEEGETGYGREELHDIAKNSILHELHPHLFENGVPCLSTRKLTSDGWQEFIKKFKELSFTVFNCYL